MVSWNVEAEKTVFEYDRMHGSKVLYDGGKISPRRGGRFPQVSAEGRRQVSEVSPSGFRPSPFRIVSGFQVMECIFINGHAVSFSAIAIIIPAGMSKEDVELSNTEVSLWCLFIFLYRLLVAVLFFLASSPFARLLCFTRRSFLVGSGSGMFVGLLG